MKFKNKFIKIIMVFLLGITALNFSLNLPVNCVANSDWEKNSWACGPSENYQKPSLSSNELSVFGVTKSDLLGSVFQIIFILFFISPPIIALMLFLIWKELKERNKMK